MPRVVLRAAPFAGRLCGIRAPRGTISARIRYVICRAASVLCASPVIVSDSGSTNRGGVQGRCGRSVARTGWNADTARTRGSRIPLKKRSCRARKERTFNLLLLASSQAICLTARQPARLESRARPESRETRSCDSETLLRRPWLEGFRLETYVGEPGSCACSRGRLCGEAELQRLLRAEMKGAGSIPVLAVR